MSMTLRLVPVLLVILLFTSACSNKDAKNEETERLGSTELYMDAKRALNNGNFPRAAQYLRRLQARFPFSEHAEQAQLELAFAYYKDRQPEKAISATDRFIKTYPTHPKVDYAYYLKGLVNFDRGGSFLSRLASGGKHDKDQRFVEQAFFNFNELLSRYPESQYAADARQRMVHLRNTMAQYELTVGQYYLRRGAWVAAVNRGKFILETYPQSPQTLDALDLMIAAYEGMDKQDLADSTREILTLNEQNRVNDQAKKKSFLSWLWPF